LQDPYGTEPLLLQVRKKYDEGLIEGELYQTFVILKLVKLQYVTNHSWGKIEGKWVKSLKNNMASLVVTLEHGTYSHLVL
jgi:hypothetical protein